MEEDLESDHFLIYTHNMLIFRNNNLRRGAVAKSIKFGKIICKVLYM